MRNFIMLIFATMVLSFVSCNDSGDQKASKSTDTAVNNGGPDSAANNGILPPSGSPANANNSSLADTAYKVKKDSSAGKHH
jgi:hypothetical protein